MKENSKKLLLLLYPSDDQVAWFNSQEISWLFPDLSQAGFQSLIFLLAKNEYLNVTKKQNKSVISLSSYGQSYLEAQFPVLKGNIEQKQGKAKLVVFLTAPSSDKNFRYLRQLLLKNQAIALTRAVFYLRSELTSTFKEELNISYKNSVIVIEAAEWLMGDEFKVIGQRINLQDNSDLYSGISNEAEQLTSILISEKGLTKQQKKQFIMVFTRFNSFLHQTNPIFFLFSPQVKSLSKIINLLQKPFKI